MIQRYRKRPVVIEAVWYDGTNLDELVEWGAPVLRQSWGEREDPRWDCGSTYRDRMANVVIGTLEDGHPIQVDHVVSVDDYVVRGIKGEFYPVKGSIFRALYDQESP